MGCAGRARGVRGICPVKSEGLGWVKK